MGIGETGTVKETPALNATRSDAEHPSSGTQVGGTDPEESGARRQRGTGHLGDRLCLGDRWGLNVGLRLGSGIASVALAPAAMVGTLVALRHGVRVGQVRYDSLVAGGYGTLWAFALVAVVALGYLLSRWRPAEQWTGVLAGVASGLMSFPLLAGLHGTPQPLLGAVFRDQGFRTEYVTRLATGWGLHDYTFANLPAFYPPGWFWVGGRWAALAGVEPWRVMKPLSILTPAVAVLLAYLMWRRAVRPATALAAAVLSAVAFSPAADVWYEPYSAFVAIAGLGWFAALAVHLRRPTVGLGSRLELILVGVVLALTYYLLFVILLLALLVFAVAHRRPRTGLLRAGVVVAAIAVLTAAFWFPFLIGLIFRGSPTQGRWFNRDFLDVATGFSDGHCVATVAGVGLVLVCLTLRAVPSRALAVLIGAEVVYQLISVASLVGAQQQLQPHRAVMMLWATLGACVPVGAQALLSRERTSPWPMPREQKALVAVVCAVLVVPAVLALATEQAREQISGPLTVAAQENEDDVAVMVAFTDRVSGFITSRAGRRPEQLTILSEYQPLLVLKPYYGFTQWNIHYAHPQARPEERVALLRAAGGCPNPTCFVRTLDRAKREPLDSPPIDAMVLARTGTGTYGCTISLDGLAQPGQVVFRGSLLDEAQWVSHDFGRFTAFVRRPLPGR